MYIKDDPRLTLTYFMAISNLNGKRCKNDFFVCFDCAFLSQILSTSTPKKFYRSSSFGDLGQRLLVSCLSTLSNDFSSELTWPISFKFHKQPSGIGGKKVLIFVSGHLIKMASMLVHANNLKKSSSPLPFNRLP